ncbi:MAG: flavin reductase family protein [Tissierellia bacterium]|nr:flavin reductase family protein [Tissierellia bacterium]
MKELSLSKVFTFIESGPVTLITTRNGAKDNVMTISWTMAMNFEGNIAISTGPWNESFETLMTNKECVVAIPTASMIEKCVRIGTINGSKVDKFKLFDLTKEKGKNVKAPLIVECKANIECIVTDYIEKYGIVILEPKRLVINEKYIMEKGFHAIGDGRFIVDGDIKDYHDLMAKWVPEGIYEK